MVDSGACGRLRATVGHIATSPGLPSVVPDRAELTVDLRNPDDADMARAEADFAAFLDTLPEAQPGLRVETAQMARTKAVPFDEGVQDALEAAAKEHGYDSLRLMSGAGHDAQEIAAIAPAAMVFVRGQYQGISHNPREYSTPEDCRAGVEVLAAAALELSA
ncbi:M20/M25/M40 family metallo-hydrolase [Brevibacterium oceani]|uniref:M20/M25/M40 family metallo-hydrolase n=1 Tax=Brevibacterium oceani TaxID=358099 RepID=UPI00359C2F74